ncbi:Uncharacterised protein [Bacillus freudenreichii]|nr:Uncharacterised protein [Bacillus freudenreichii]
MKKSKAGTDDIKIVGIIILMVGLLTILSLGMDFLLGFDFIQAIDDWIRPFYVMSPAEKIIYTICPLVILLRPVFARFQKKK